MNYSFKKVALIITLTLVAIGASLYLLARHCYAPTPATPLYGTSTLQGKRAEDRIVIDKNEDTHLFSLFDGYGGKTTINYLTREFNHLIAQQLPQHASPQEIEDLLKRLCAKVDQDLFLIAQSPETHRCSTPGSTATTVMVTPHHVIIMSIGDSQVLLKNKNGSLWLSPGHKPDDPEEKERIEKAGLTIDYVDVPRVLWHSTARGLGDFHVNKEARAWEKIPGISAQPAITIFNRTDVAWLLVGSDGLWDGLSFELAPEVPEENKKTLTKTTLSAAHVKNIAEQISLFLKGSKNLTHLAWLLTQKAEAGWLSSRRPVDDISALVVMV